MKEKKLEEQLDVGSWQSCTLLSNEQNNLGPWNSYRMGVQVKMYGLKATASYYNQIDGEIFQVLTVILIYM